MEDSIFLSIVDQICKKYDCWIEWDKSDIEKRELSINGDTEENMIDCAEELDNIMLRKKQNENIYCV